MLHLILNSGLTTETFTETDHRETLDLQEFFHMLYSDKYYGVFAKKRILMHTAPFLCFHILLKIAVEDPNYKEHYGTIARHC